MDTILWIALLFIIGIILELFNVKKKKQSNINILNDFYPNLNIMTKTETKFYKNILQIAESNNLLIFPQVRISILFKTKKQNIASFNKIKAKSIDFVLVDKDTLVNKIFIELDDYTHKYKSTRDTFINQLFNTHNLTLLRIPVANNYNLIELEQKIKESL